MITITSKWIHQIDSKITIFNIVLIKLSFGIIICESIAFKTNKTCQVCMICGLKFINLIDFSFWVKKDRCICYLMLYLCCNYSFNKYFIIVYNNYIYIYKYIYKKIIIYKSKNKSELWWEQSRLLQKILQKIPKKQPILENEINAWIKYVFRYKCCNDIVCPNRTEKNIVFDIYILLV